MTLQKIIQNIKDIVAPSAEADSLITAFQEESRGVNYWAIRPKDFPSGNAILTAHANFQIGVLIRLVEKYNGYGRTTRLDSLQSALLGRKLPLTRSDLERLLMAMAPSGDPHYYPSYIYSIGTKLTQRVKDYLEMGEELTPPMRIALKKMRDKASEYPATEWRKITGAFAELLGDANAGLPDAGESWADAALIAYAALSTEEQLHWKSVFKHALDSETAKPSAKWNAAALEHVQSIGIEKFAILLAMWFSKVSLPNLPSSQGPPCAEGEDFVISGAVGLCINEKSISILKGLAWYAVLCNVPAVAPALAHLADVSFRKIPAHGAWATRTGNAAIWALGQMPNGAGVGPLARLRAKLRDRTALKLIASSIETAAAKAGMTVDELEDMAVPTGGLDADGTRRETFGDDGAATLTLDAKTAKTNLQWFGPDGRPRKAVPAAVKASAAAEVKALKAAEEEIKQALGAQAARLDRALLDERSWTGAEWRERYLSHPILGNLARRLLWTFDGQDGLPVGDEIVTSENGRLDLRDSTVVRLWHPIGHTPQEVMRWRDALEARGIVQPFKQAHREVYLLTDAERNTRTYSNRFAAHILKQHQFNSLAVLRGWKNQLRLMVDSSYPPATKELPQHTLRAEFWIEGIGDDYGTDTNETGTYLRVVTDQVRFYRTDAPTNHAHAGSGGYGPLRAARAEEALPLDHIPPLVFSEVMRDVDLFVGVASLGNDPNWADGGPQGRFRNYWNDYSFGDLPESAKTRADVLARLLPRLKIAGRCRLDGRFLTVCGDIRTYKIHLGSGNILMEPNDQYLCIVPKSGGDETGGLFLPFEGDRTLAVILSKAFLLADDTRITDPTITRQIQVK